MWENAEERSVLPKIPKISHREMQIYFCPGDYNCQLYHRINFQTLCMYIYTFSISSIYYLCILNDLCLITLNCYFIMLFSPCLKSHGYLLQVFFKMNNSVKFCLFTYIILHNVVLNMPCKEQIF